MEKTEIKEKLIGIIKTYVPEEISLDNVGDDQDLINDLQINSAHIVDIVLDIEDTFDIMIEDEVIGEMNTVQDSVNIIASKVAENA
ncbi:MAG: acyl carrier protein [Cyclobacteriaceae bacterium]|jgi:acyl carrier protein